MDGGSGECGHIPTGRAEEGPNVLMRFSLSQKVETNCKVDSLMYAQNPLCFVMLKMRSSMSSRLKFRDYVDVRTRIDSIASTPLGICRWLC